MIDRSIAETIVSVNLKSLPDYFTSKDLMVFGIGEKMARKICNRLLKEGKIIKHIERNGAIKKYIFEKIDKRKRPFENIISEFVKELTLPVPLTNNLNVL